MPLGICNYVQKMQLLPKLVMFTFVKEIVVFQIDDKNIFNSFMITKFQPRMTESLFYIVHIFYL